MVEPHIPSVIQQILYTSYIANTTRSHRNVYALILVVKILTSYTANDHSGDL